MNKVKILIISATELEIKPLLTNGCAIISDNLFSKTINNIEVNFLITGVGIHAMSYAFTKHLVSNSYSFIILAGIAGSYSSKYNIGDVVNIKQECFADLGQFSENGFNSLFDMGFGEKNLFPFSEGKLKNYTLINNSVVNNLPDVEANTVQSIRSENTNNLTPKADVESMEGAAFFYVCMMEKQAFIEIRAISNYVGEIDKSKWDIPWAVGNLSRKIIEIIDEI